MEQIISLFNSILPLSQQDIILLKDHLYIEKITKNKTYAIKGHKCKKISFVNKGIFKVIKTNSEGDLFIPYFITKGHFAVDIDSFSNNTNSEESIETVTDCEVVVITDVTYAFFEKEIANFLKIISIIKERALLQKMKMKNEMLVDNASTKYRKLLERQPEIIQQVPQSQIALFLGITQYTLSRIKSNI